MEKEKLLLRVCEVEKLMGLGKSKTYELIAEGIIPSVKIGRCVRVPAGSLRELVEELSKSAKSSKKNA